MSFSKSKGQFRHTSISYSLVRSLIAEKNREMFKGKQKTEQTKKNMKGRSGKWKRSDSHKKKMSERQKGKGPTWMNLSHDDPKRKIIIKKLSDRMIGDNNPMSNAESREKMKLTLSRKKWFTNGNNDVFSEECPVGFESGRSKNKKEKI